MYLKITNHERLTGTKMPTRRSNQAKALLDMSFGCFAVNLTDPLDHIMQVIPVIVLKYRCFENIL